jgi:hypothetical protein
VAKITAMDGRGGKARGQKMTPQAVIARAEKSEAFAAPAIVQLQELAPHQAALLIRITETAAALRERAAAKIAAWCRLAPGATGLPTYRGPDVFKGRRLRRAANDARMQEAPGPALARLMTGPGVRGRDNNGMEQP